MTSTLSFKNSYMSIIKRGTLTAVNTARLQAGKESKVFSNAQTVKSISLKRTP